MERLPAASHIEGELIFSSRHPEAYSGLIQVLDELRIEDCLNPSEPYHKGRGGTPKAQKFGKTNSFAPRPISQKLMNSRIAAALKAQGWGEQPLVDQRELILKTPYKLTKLKGDFYKDRTFVEVEFGNMASFFRNLFKFQVAGQAHTADVGVLIMATRRTAGLFDSGVTHFESGCAKLPYIQFINMPIVMIGIRPESFDAVEARYREMTQVLEANGKQAVPWERYQRSFLK